MKFVKVILLLPMVHTMGIRGLIVFGCWLLAVPLLAAQVRLAVLEIDSPQLGKLATLLKSELIKLPDF